MKKLSLFAAATAAAALALTGCSSATTDDATTDTADSNESTEAAEPVTVQAEMYAFAWLAEQVGGDLVEVTQIVPAGVGIHTYEVSAKQADEIGSADLAIYTAGAAAAVDEAIEQQAPAAVVNIADQITLLPAVDEGEEHEGEEHEEGEEEHDHGAYDPHTWIDLHEMPAMITAIADSLSEVDPDNAATYEANAATVTETITALDAKYATELATCEETTFFITHPAFGYIANAYGLTQVGISGFDEDTEPSPAKLAEVSDLIEQYGTTTLFFPNTSNEKVATVLAEDLDITTAVLSTLTAAPEGKDLVSLLEGNLESLRTGLGCS